MTNNDFIYPECPGCGTKAGAGEGVGLHQIPHVVWHCPDCKRVSEGTFLPGATSVKWTETRPPTLGERLKRDGHRVALGGLIGSFGGALIGAAIGSSVGILGIVLGSIIGVVCWLLIERWFVP